MSRTCSKHQLHGVSTAHTRLPCVVDSELLTIGERAVQITFATQLLDPIGSGWHTCTASGCMCLAQLVSD